MQLKKLVAATHGKNRQFFYNVNMTNEIVPTNS